MELKYTDGGRAEAGFKGDTGDCVVRAIAIATEKPYIEVYKDLQVLCKGNNYNSPRTGIHREIYEPYLESLGWEWIPTMFIGKGCVMHLNEKELPPGRLICSVSKHVCAVIDGVLHDNFDHSRGGKRCVYGYYKKSE